MHRSVMKYEESLRQQNDRLFGFSGRRHQGPVNVLPVAPLRRIISFNLQPYETRQPAEPIQYANRIPNFLAEQLIMSAPATEDGDRVRKLVKELRGYENLQMPPSRITWLNNTDEDMLPLLTPGPAPIGWGDFN
jgi:hypothetical protein